MAKSNIDNIIELSNELRWQIGDDFHDNLTEAIYADAANIVSGSVQVKNSKKRFRLDAKIDNIVTSKIFRPCNTWITLHSHFDVFPAVPII